MTVTTRLRILSGTYSVENDEPVIELFGRTPDGKSITLRYTGFKPYFYIVSDMPFVKKYLEGDTEIISLERTVLEVKNKPTTCVKVTLKSPWKVPRYRQMFNEYTKVLAADIPFVHRFIYDLDLSPCVEATGTDRSDLLRANGGPYTTDLVIECNSPRDITNVEDFKPPLSILSFDIENSIKTGKIYTIGIYARQVDGTIKERALEGTEQEIIQGLEDTVAEWDPDIITGYNIEGYDFPHILKRARLFGHNSLKIGRNRMDLKKAGSRYFRASGRVIADAWWNVKREVHPKKETLNAVARLLLGEEKMDVDRLDIEGEWETDKGKVKEYCLKDARLALEILEKIRVINKYFDLSTVSKLPLDDTMNSGSSTLIDSILIREADRRGIGVPCNSYGHKQDQITGGYVHSIQPGLYNWVIVLDFKSMYPSIMISKNICFTTLSEDGETVCPETGARFLTRDIKRGLIPEILEGLMARRDDIKARMKKAKQEGNEQAMNYYDGLQAAVKILMNSVYGVFASSFYRFTNQRIGASITAFARDNIKHIITTLESEGYSVIYSDTDSVFFISPEKNLEGTLEIGKRIANRFSQEGKVLEFEKVLNPFFSHGVKKRYVGRIVWPEESIIVRGYEIRRTDSFDLQSEALQKLFYYVLDNRIDDGLRYSKEVVEDILKGNVPVEKLVISKSVKGEDSYKNGSNLPHVKAAQKLRALGHEVVPGMKVSFVVVSTGKSQDVEPYIEGQKFTGTPDYRYYASRVAQSLSRVTEVFGWTEKELLTGMKQSSLGDFASQSAGQKPRRVEPKPKIKEKTSLDDYF